MHLIVFPGILATFGMAEAGGCVLVLLAVTALFSSR